MVCHYTDFIRRRFDTFPVSANSDNDCLGGYTRCFYPKGGNYLNRLQKSRKHKFLNKRATYEEFDFHFIIT